MTDSERAAEEIVEYLRKYEYLAEMPCDEETGVMLTIRALIDKHLC